MPVPKRVLFLTSTFPRWEGDSTPPFVLHLAQDLSHLGVEVDVLAPQSPGAAPEEVLGGIYVKRFRYLYPESSQTVCYDGGALKNLESRKKEFLKLPFLVFSEWWHCFYSLLRRNYDVLHSHWILPQGFTGVLSALPLSVPHVLTVHGSDIFSLQHPLFLPFKRFALCSATAVTANSSCTLSKVQNIAPSIRTLKQIPMGVALPSHDLQRPMRITALRSRYKSGKGPLLIFVGRLVEQKGVEDLILAVKTLSERMKDITCIIVGEGPDRARLEELVNCLGVGDRVYFVGWIQHDQLFDYYRAADVFIGPSRQSKSGGTEAQGLSFLEAMTVGTPVIATKAGGVTDFVQHEKTGLLVRERSPGDICSAINNIFQNPELRERISASAYNLVVSRYSREATASGFYDLFRQIIAKKT